MSDINYDPDDEDANGITYSLDVETRNYQLNDGQREALREAMVLSLQELQIKMELLMGKSARVRGFIAPANCGRRELHVPQDATNE